MIFHIPGLGHTQTNKSFLSCAFTQKVLKLCKMLIECGHTVYHYGCEGSEVICTEDVAVVQNVIRRAAYPENDDRTKPYRFQSAHEYDAAFNQGVISAICERVQGQGEFLLCAWGLGHKPIADALSNVVIPVESGIGYIGTFARFRVFESSAHMHWTWGREGRDDGDWWSTVIPNFFEPADFKYQCVKNDYLLYLGRITKRKGVQLAAEIAKTTNHRLVISGQGLPSDEDVDIAGDLVEFVGYADYDKRRELLAGAKALICPTWYIEPFGGVAVEAQLSGTPVICTDWGGFKENVIDGKTGFRCSTFKEFCEAVERVHTLHPLDCRMNGLSYSCENIVGQYERYFTRILNQGALFEDRHWYTL